MLIAIDDQVYAELGRRAVPYVDREPNDTVRRVLGLPPTHAEAATSSSPPTPPLARGRRERGRKVQLSELVSRGLLTRGETLVCVDYSGNAIPGGNAEVGTGNKLVMRGAYYSMSGLARQLLRTTGHPVDVVRGPAHWRRTADGRTVLAIWRERDARG
jgi:hypothetical protein